LAYSLILKMQMICSSKALGCLWTMALKPSRTYLFIFTAVRTSNLVFYGWSDLISGKKDMDILIVWLEHLCFAKNSTVSIPQCEHSDWSSVSFLRVCNSWK
jgi:hypothetical protein